jgi:hypothetical protein
MTDHSTGGSPGAGTPPLCEGLVELDRLIAKQSRSVSARRQLAETESLPALKASKARHGHPAVRAMPANPRHGKQHRSILAIEEEELLALQSARADYASQSATIVALRQHLADAVVTARYQSDVTRQADDAREKAEQERDAVIVTAADTIFTTTQTWIEKLAAAQAENAELRAENVMLVDGLGRLGISRGTVDCREAWWHNDANGNEPLSASLAEAADAMWTEYVSTHNTRLQERPK